MKFNFGGRRKELKERELRNISFERSEVKTFEEYCSEENISLSHGIRTLIKAFLKEKDQNTTSIGITYNLLEPQKELTEEERRKTILNNFESAFKELLTITSLENMDPDTFKRFKDSILKRLFETRNPNLSNIHKPNNNLESIVQRLARERQEREEQEQPSEKELKQS